MTAQAKHPFFSVILPIYGVEAFLPTSIACLLAQTFEDFELILVDDASPDQSHRIAEKACELDERVSLLVHPQNRGLGEARNTGLAAARGTYVWMPDADDEFALDALERLAQAIQVQEEQPDVLLFGLTERYFSQDGTQLYDNTIVPAAGVYASPEQWKDKVATLERQTLFGYAWNKVYKRELIEKASLHFETTRLIEDILFNRQFFEHVSSLVCLDAPLYFYRKQDGRSLTNANAYSAREFWQLHQRRVAELCGLYDALGTSEEAYAIEGSLYVRYLISTLERSHHSQDRWTRTERDAWLDEVFATELFGRLVPVAQAEQSTSLKSAILAAQYRDKGALKLIGLSAYAARVASPTVFTRTRSGR